jgi:VIT family
MGIGGFLASQAERDHYRYLRRTTQARVKRLCGGEVERKVHAILGPVGLDQKVSEQVAHGLLEVEAAIDESISNGQTSALADAEHGLKMSESSGGVTEFLLKFGEGLGARSLMMWIFTYSGLCFAHFLIQRRSQRVAFTCLHLPLGWAISSVARSR